MSHAYKGADPKGFNDEGKGMKKDEDKSLGVEHTDSGEDGGYDPEKDYEAKSDADTLHRAHEIKNDPDRHQKAAYHLEKRAGAAKDAHKDTQKSLHKQVKKGLKKAFPSGGAQNFGAEKEKETAEAENIVNEKRV